MEDTALDVLLFSVLSSDKTSTSPTWTQIKILGIYEKQNFFDVILQIWRTAVLLNRTLYLLFQVALWNEQLFCATRSDIGQRPSNHISPLYQLLLSVVWLGLTQFRMGFFGAAHGWGDRKVPFPKICHIYPIMMKLDTVIPYLRKIQKMYKLRAHLLSSADISIFSPKISKFCYIKKSTYRLDFDA